MKKKTKWILGGMALIIGAMCLAGYIYFQYFFHLHLFEAGPTRNVNLAGWEKLERGMTKAEVASLLGESLSTFGPGRGSVGSNEYTVAETWQYNWTTGLSIWGETHPKSYIVRFGPDGTLASWREPLEKENNPEPGP